MVNRLIDVEDDKRLLGLAEMSIADETVGVAEAIHTAEAAI